MKTQPSLWLKNWQSPLILAGIVLVSFWLVITLQQQKLNKVLQGQLNNTDYQKQEEVEKVNLDILQTLPSFGFGNVIADWTLLNFIQYYGDIPARRETGHVLSPEYLDIIVKNDPRFVRAYLILSPASSVNAGMPERTISAFEKGLKSLSPNIPNAYMVWLYKGVDEILFEGDARKAQQSYQIAADWARIAGDERIANSAQKTVNFLAKNPDSREAQVGAWFMVFVNTRDREVQAIAKSNIERLGGTLTVYPDGRVTAIAPKDAITK